MSVVERAIMCVCLLSISAYLSRPGYCYLVIVGLWIQTDVGFITIITTTGYDKYLSFIRSRPYCKPLILNPTNPPNVAARIVIGIDNRSVICVKKCFSSHLTLDIDSQSIANNTELPNPAPISFTLPHPTRSIPSSIPTKQTIIMPSLTPSFAPCFKPSNIIL